jgi:hypothetical protein
MNLVKYVVQCSSIDSLDKASLEREGDRSAVEGVISSK